LAEGGAQSSHRSIFERYPFQEFANKKMAEMAGETTPKNDFF
jgi:hypothetical protein